MKFLKGIYVDYLGNLSNFWLFKPELAAPRRLLPRLTMLEIYLTDENSSVLSAKPVLPAHAFPTGRLSLQAGTIQNLTIFLIDRQFEGPILYHPALQTVSINKNILKGY